MDRNSTIQYIKTALRRRSHKQWSVTGGRGTAYGWITIDAPPKRQTWSFHGEGTISEGNLIEVNDKQPGCGHIGPAEREELKGLLGLPDPVHFQGISIPAGNDYYQEYIDRSSGQVPSVIGTPYWD